MHDTGWSRTSVSLQQLRLSHQLHWPAVKYNFWLADQSGEDEAGEDALYDDRKAYPVSRDIERRRKVVYCHGQYTRMTI